MRLTLRVDLDLFEQTAFVMSEDGQRLEVKLNLEREPAEITPLKRELTIYNCTHCSVTFSSLYDFEGSAHDACEVRLASGQAAGSWFIMGKVEPESGEPYDYARDDLNFCAARETSLGRSKGRD